jgi:6-phosphogluconolactonase/glucosamine-6-phosphate isomerase/deaminase
MKRLMQAETLCLMAFGAGKAPVMRRALIEEPSPDCPASLLQRRETLQVLIDRPLFTAL